MVYVYASDLHDGRQRGKLPSVDGPEMEKLLPKYEDRTRARESV